MRGMDRIIELRRSGYRPEWVCLDMPGLGYSSGLIAEGQVLIGITDRPGLVDLRPLVGLTVTVMGAPEQFGQVEAWARQACAAGAKTVGLFVTLPGQGRIDGPAWIRINGEDIA